MKWAIRIGLVLLMIQLYSCGFAYKLMDKSVGQIGLVLLLLTSVFWLRAFESKGPLRQPFLLGVLILCLVAVPRWRGVAGLVDHGGQGVSDMVRAGYWLGLLLAWVVPTGGMIFKSQLFSSSAGDKGGQTGGDSSDTPEMKSCPDCAEDVRAAARKCRFCGYRFDSAEQ